MSDETLELFGGTEFLTGLRWGMAALIVAILVAAVLRRLKTEPAPVGGLVLAAAALGGMGIARAVSAELWLGVVLLAAAGWLGSILPWRVLSGAALSLPGAWLVGHGGQLPGEPWIPNFVTVVIVFSVPLVARFDRLHDQRALGLPLLAVAVVGVFFAVPDTEEALVLLGVTLPLALSAWPVPAIRLGSAGSFAAVGVVLWVVAVGGYGRTGSIIGGAACLGLLVAEPAGRWWHRRGEAFLDVVDPLVAGFAQLVVVFLASRVAGLQEGVRDAALIAGPLLVVAAVLSGWSRRPRVSVNLEGRRGPDEPVHEPSNPGAGQAGRQDPPGPD